MQGSFCQQFFFLWLARRWFNILGGRLRWILSFFRTGLGICSRSFILGRIGSVRLPPKSVRQKTHVGCFVHPLRYFVLGRNVVWLHFHASVLLGENSLSCRHGWTQTFLDFLLFCSLVVIMLDCQLKGQGLKGQGFRSSSVDVLCNRRWY